jgi:competence protein ComEC
MQGLIIPLRRYIRRTVDRTVGPDGYLVIGILLGEKRDMPEEVLDDFRTTGLMHLLAVSGLNVGMLMLIFYQLFTALFMPHRLKILLTIAVVWLYAAVTDLSPSVVRAAIMGSVILMGWMLERKSFIYNSLAFSALLILLFRPLYLYDLGFILSYSATLAIVYVYPKWKKSLPWAPRNFIVKNLFDSLLVSLAAMAGTIPIIAYSFNNIAPVSLVANLVAVPLSFVLLALGLLLTVFGPLPILAKLYGASAYYVTGLLNKAVALFAKVPFGYLIAGSPEIAGIVFYFIILVCATEMREKRWARKAFAFILVFAACFYNARAFAIEKPLATVTFLDVGQGDGAVIGLQGGKTFLIDGGPKDPYVDNGARVVYPFLKHEGVRQLEAVFSSHSHNDHIGGLFWIMDKVRIRRLFDSGKSDEGPEYGEYLRRIGEKMIPRTILSAGDRIQVTDKISFDVLHPDSGYKSASPNENSVVLRFRAGNYSVLFTGDIDSTVEARILQAIDTLKVDVIKVAHHGAKSSSSTAFLEKCAPSAAVISVGRHNRFGHPHAETRARFQREGAKVFRTDEDGAAVLRIFKDSYDISGIAGAAPAMFCHH